MRFKKLKINIKVQSNFRELEKMKKIIEESWSSTSKTINSPFERVRNPIQKAYGKMVLISNKSLFVLVQQLLIQEIEKDKNNKEKHTISGLLVTKKARSNTNSFLLLILSFSIYTIFSSITASVNIYIVLIIALLMILLFVRQRILMYRIKRGYYGSYESEVREILTFLIEHNNKDDFFDGDDVKSIFPAKEELVNNNEKSIFGWGGVYGR